MTDSDAFRLSRVYAEGWNAANRASAEDAADSDQGRAVKLNPYKNDPEKSRWSEGFAKALAN